MYKLYLHPRRYRVSSCCGPAPLGTMQRSAVSLAAQRTVTRLLLISGAARVPRLVWPWLTADGSFSRGIAAPCVATCGSKLTKAQLVALLHTLWQCLAHKNMHFEKSILGGTVLPSPLSSGIGKCGSSWFAFFGYVFHICSTWHVHGS